MSHTAIAEDGLTEGAARRQDDVKTWRVDPHSHVSDHEQAAHAHFARELAQLKKITYRGAYSAEEAGDGLSYVLPNATIVLDDPKRDACLTRSRRPVVNDLHDLYGGVVPHAFVATKAISHGLHGAAGARPEGWSESLGQAIRPMTLRGYTVFCGADALRAGQDMLALGPVRVKAVGATGGKGQWVAHSRSELKRCLAEIDQQGMLEQGVVLEENLEQCITLSVGQVTVAGHVISYHGTQYTTPDNTGGQAYGGSDLCVVRGGFNELLALDLTPAQRLAIDQARRYHGAVEAAYPTFFASRVNYDVAQGVATDGWRSGVLEQSWRIGGATSAEVAALVEFDRSPDCTAIWVSSGERYGGAALPPGASVYFDGEDSLAGPITRFTCQHRAQAAQRRH